MKVDCWMRSWNEIRWTRTLGRRSYHDFHGFELQMNLTSKWAYPISRVVSGSYPRIRGGVYGDRGRTWKGGKTRVFCLSKPKNWHKNRVPGGGTLSYGGSFLAFLRVFRGFWGYLDPRFQASQKYRSEIMNTYLEHRYQCTQDQDQFRYNDYWAAMVHCL